MQRVGNLGCGLMGAGIAEVSARAGCDVTLVEASRPAADAGLARVQQSLQRAQARGKLNEAGAVLGRIRVTLDLDELADRELVIEAVVEDEGVKTDPFGRLDKIRHLAGGCPRLEYVVNPRDEARRRRLTSAAGDRDPPLQPGSGAPARLAGAQPAHRARDHHGRSGVRRRRTGQDGHRLPGPCRFRSERPAHPFVLSAVRTLESCFASAEDIDRGLVLGAAHPQGRLALADLIGIDTTKAVAESLYAEFKKHLYAAPSLLNRMGDAGLLGRKTGRGFYTYE